DELPAWCGDQAPPRVEPVAQGVHVGPRDHVVVENRHQPTTLHLRTYVDQRYKLTVYRHHDYGELFDLQEDPEEVHNRWDDPAAEPFDRARPFGGNVDVGIRLKPDGVARTVVVRVEAAHRPDRRVLEQCRGVANGELAQP